MRSPNIFVRFDSKFNLPLNARLQNCIVAHSPGLPEVNESENIRRQITWLTEPRHDLKWRKKAPLATLFHNREVLNHVCVGCFNYKAMEESIPAGIAAQWVSRNHSSRLLCWIGVWNVTRCCLITHLLFWTSVPLNPPLAHWWLTLLAEKRHALKRAVLINYCWAQSVRFIQMHAVALSECNYAVLLFASGPLYIADSR